MWECRERNIAVRAAMPSLVVQVKGEPEIPVELAQLTFDVIAGEERVTAAEELAQHQSSITREQPPVFSDRSLDQQRVRDRVVVSRVVTKNAQPACEAAEHRIGDEAPHQRGSVHDEERPSLFVLRSRCGWNSTP